MPCDKLIVIEDDTTADTQQDQTKEKKIMSHSTLVLRRMPEFEMDAYNAATGHYVTISSEQLKEKWAVVCFYPKELIRQLEAWQHAHTTGEVCPANWRKGKKTLPVNTDEENMTGNVGAYVTLEDILS